MANGNVAIRSIYTDHGGNGLRGCRRQSPAQMTMSRVVKDTRAPATTHARQHAWQHRSQSCPWNNSRGGDDREVSTHPIDQWFDPIRTNIPVHAVELCCARNPEPVCPKTAGDDLRAVIEDAHPGSAAPTRFIIQMYRDRIALDGIDVHMIAQHRSEPATADAGTDDDAIKDFASLVGRNQNLAAVHGFDAVDCRVVVKLHAATLAGR
ncbi:hypothetical protein PT2222_490003 [Paraburkholderia tropica]